MQRLVQEKSAVVATRRNSPAHLVLRLPMNVAPLDEIIEKHNAVAKSSGSVWFAISGRSPKPARLEMFKEQIQCSIPTFLYVLQREHDAFKVFQADILSLGQDAPETELHLIPPYYAARSILSSAVLWLRVRQFTEQAPTSVNRFYVQTTRNPLMDALKGMSSLLIVSDSSHARDALRGNGNL